ncbi:hypothetical protein LVD13_05020 [Flavobacteriaceae bacterium D16]|nr:hypothetical protein [Flavobacteriaceae bacterium D16]
MRSVHISILFLVSIQLFGQEPKAIELQNHWIKEAQKDLKSNNLFGAFCAYRYAYDIIPNSELGGEIVEAF